MYFVIEEHALKQNKKMVVRFQYISLAVCALEICLDL